MNLCNIERGIKGSTAKHTEVKEYYARVNRQSFNLDQEQTLPTATLTETAIAWFCILLNSYS